MITDEIKERVVEKMIPYGDTEKLSSPPWVNLSLIVINAGVFIYVFFVSKAPLHLITSFGFIPNNFFNSSWNPLVNGFKYLTLITANFLHGDYLHIIGNMLFLFVFGDNLEDRLGHFRYLLFYLLCGILAILTHGYTCRNSTMVLIGASGAIAGVMGGFYILLPRARIKSWFVFFHKEIPAVYFLFVWFGFNLARGLFHLEGKMLEPVAWWAHIGGFISGALLVNLFLTGPPQVKATVKTGVKSGSSGKKSRK